MINKWMIGLLLVIVSPLIVVYIFIPNNIPLRSGAIVNVPGQALHRVLQDNSSISRWWPGSNDTAGLKLNGRSYLLNQGNITVLPVSIKGTAVNLITSLYLISKNKDTTRLEWVGKMAIPFNPVKRIPAYLEAKQLQRDMNAILDKMKDFYSVPENIYGFKIQHTLVLDSNLIATAGRSKGYPTTGFIYNLINKLRAYAILHSAKETGYPMLNVGTADSLWFDVRVALPTNKLLPTYGDIEQKSMPGRNIILKTEVKGGIGITTRAFGEIKNYADDYQYKAPAIPFYSLVTDRAKETDTSKWITVIYFPVMIYPK